MGTAMAAALRSGAAPPEQKDHRGKGLVPVVRERSITHPRGHGKEGRPCESSV